ncbi:hypothetical protein SFRURICE_021116 [Spodoptera frugiperda]|nr:hypothetical protein SFRURICE_021116 [Spodoptera frugiperda]
MATINNIREIDKIEIAKTIECDGSELNKHVYVNKNDLTIISQNIRSIYCNFDDFLLTLSTVKFEADIILLTECRLSANKPIPQLINYQSYMTARQLNQNDGVVVYVKGTLKTRVKEIPLSQASCLQLDVLNNTILCIYRSPSNINTDSFIDSLSTHLDSITSHKSIIIAGDININIIKKPIEQSHEQKNRTNYLNMLSLHGILPGHLLPTRDKTCLDHFMLKINKIKFSATIAILHTTITDHFTTLLVLTKQKHKQVIPKTTTSLNYGQALIHLQEKNLSDLLFCHDADYFISKRNEPIDEFEIIIHACQGEYGNNCNCPSVRKVTEVKYLGVVVDNRLSWYPHVEQVTARIRNVLLTLTCCNLCHASSFTSRSSNFLSWLSTTLSNSSTSPSGLSSSLSLLPRLLGDLSSDWDTLRRFTAAVRYSKSESDRSLSESDQTGSALIACRSSAASCGVAACSSVCRAPPSQPQRPPLYWGHAVFRQILCFGASSSSSSLIS